MSSRQSKDSEMSSRQSKDSEWVVDSKDSEWVVDRVRILNE